VAVVNVAIIGAGWAGCVTARVLHDRGVEVHVFERTSVIGGHSRAEKLNGVVFEPNGPHIFHTSNRRVAEFVQAAGMTRPYQHKVLTEVFLDGDDDEPRLLSWPPQVDELAELPIWNRIEKELGQLPETPSCQDLESYCESLMGPTLYRLFVRDYSIKQWGRHPSGLSSRFAPGRLDLRRDGNRRLFRDTWEFFPPEGSQQVIESVLRQVPVSVGCELSIADLPELERRYDVVVITAALDDFVGRPDELQWRGVRIVSRYLPTDDPSGTRTPAYVVNRPSLRRPYTRTVETKHASGQLAPGTVVSEEYPGAPARHYPVFTVDGRNERRNAELQEEIRSCMQMRVYFCGRLANYAYINQDQAIKQAFDCAERILADAAEDRGGVRRCSS
jgi:UDP-galactopyranose mutase